jgi:hypothetical protein
MSDGVVPVQDWREFLESFIERYRGSLVRLEIHDVETGEDVGSQYLPLHSLELDLEDLKNPRVNITVGSDHKLTKHVLFRPSRLTLRLSDNGAEESLAIQSLNTTTTVRFRAAALPDRVA